MKCATSIHGKLHSNKKESTINWLKTWMDLKEIMLDE